MVASDNFDRKVFPKDALIVEEGEPGASAFLIQSGQVEVYRTLKDKEVVLSKLGPGEIFGEMALLFNEPRSASVRAAQNSTLVIMNRDIFQHKLKNSDPTVRAIVRMLSRRVLSANESLMSEQHDLESLLSATKLLFEKVCDNLPGIQQHMFEDDVRPKFEAFLSAVEALEERFEIDIDAHDDKAF